MTENWEKVQLSEIIHVKHGYAFKSEYFVEDGDHIVLTPGNFYEEGGFKHKETEKWYDGPIPEEYILSQGDLLVAMTEQSQGLLGSAIRIPESGIYLHNQRLGLIKTLDESVSLDYIYYLFNSPYIRSQISASANGAKVRHTSPTRIGEVEVKLPPLETQKTIAAVLSTYDNLIRTNQKRIHILEEMGRVLHRKWFVDYRFEGYDSFEMVNSKEGDIPEGWEIDQVGNRFEVVLGGTPARKKPEYWEGNVPWIKSGKVNETRVVKPSEYITKKGLEGCTTELMPRGTSLIAITGSTLGQVSLLGIESAANQSVVGVYNKSKIYNEFLYYTFKERIEELVAYASGGAQQHINKTIVSEFKLVIPPESIVKSFHELCAPINDLLLTLLKRNNVLRQIHRLLLPKLITGKLMISELEVPKLETKDPLYHVP